MSILCRYVATQSSSLSGVVEFLGLLQAHVLKTERCGWDSTCFRLAHQITEKAVGLWGAGKRVTDHASSRTPHTSTVIIILPTFFNLPKFVYIHCPFNP